MPKKSRAKVQPNGLIGDIIQDRIKSFRQRTTTQDFAYRLTSRKFWLTAIVCIYFMIRGYAAAFGAFDSQGREVADIAALSAAFSSLTQIVIAFLAIQGGTDALVKFMESRDKEELDSRVINAAQNVRLATQVDNVPVNVPAEESGPPSD